MSDFTNATQKSIITLPHSKHLSKLILQTYGYSQPPIYSILMPAFNVILMLASLPSNKADKATKCQARFLLALLLRVLLTVGSSRSLLATSGQLTQSTSKLQADNTI